MNPGPLALHECLSRGWDAVTYYQWTRALWPSLDKNFRPAIAHRAVRRYRRASSNGFRYRVADPFRQRPEGFADGTVTGRFERVTAVEMTAVTDARRTTGEEKLL